LAAGSPATREQAHRFFAAWNEQGAAAAVKRFWDPRIAIEVVDTEQVGDQILIEAIVRGHGSASGAPTEMRDFFLIENGDPLTIRFREFLGRDEALAVVQ
jgi:hypothetical protein